MEDDTPLSFVDLSLLTGFQVTIIGRFRLTAAARRSARRLGVNHRLQIQCTVNRVKWGRTLVFHFENCRIVILSYHYFSHHDESPCSIV